jgi:intracellular septation protein
MKFLFDILTIVLFFITYKLSDIYIATGVLIVVTLAKVGWIWIWQRQFEETNLITAGLVIVFGGATLFLHDPVFVKWKPTVVNWLFSITFLSSLFASKKPMLKLMLGHRIDLPNSAWIKLTFAWAIFFLALGLVNLYVAFTFDEPTWVNFKLFGMVGLMLLFALAQAAYTGIHLKADSNSSSEGS